MKDKHRYSPPPLPIFLPKQFHINQPKLVKCFGWPESAKKPQKSLLCDIFPSFILNDKFENHFPAGVATLALNAFVPAGELICWSICRKGNTKESWTKGKWLKVNCNIPGGKWRAREKKTDNSATKLMSESVQPLPGLGKKLLLTLLPGKTSWWIVGE